VRARLHDLAGPMDGTVYVKTGLMSVGVEMVHGGSHLTVFAGEDWLSAKVAEAIRKESESGQQP
jgi:hypothetical protein